MKLLFVLLQYLLPHHLLSRLTGRLAAARVPWLKNALISAFIRRYGVDMSEALEPDAGAYPDFNAFFTRALRPDARPLPDGAGAVCCPADGKISEIGAIDLGRVLQAKGQSYALTALLGGDSTLAETLENGVFATIYLSPRDYHRVHMPLSGTLQRMTYVPGRLFSVNQTTVDNVPDLFARNERVICVFETEAGPMVMVLVGAMIVAAVETVWAGQVAPLPRRLQSIDYTQPQRTIALDRGEEMGRFRLGSTVIVLFGAGAVDWDPELLAGAAVRLGQTLGQRL